MLCNRIKTAADVNKIKIMSYFDQLDDPKELYMKLLLIKISAKANTNFSKREYSKNIVCLLKLFQPSTKKLYHITYTTINSAHLCSVKTKEKH